ncbi:hypothetical protein V6N12_058321 [Hibiscus sabdariffa]|uniref:Uncharacterized protein n=1 Tax=Hibiscus sabdariffa TaxID=183260 RepID=A0ABR2ETM6_9ROSI
MTGPSMPGLLSVPHDSTSKQTPRVTPPIDKSKHSAIILPDDSASIRHSDIPTKSLLPTVLSAEAIEQ